MYRKNNKTGTETLMVPGFNLPIDAWTDGKSEVTWRSSSQRFQTGLDDVQPARLTTREICMLNFMNLITDKAAWWDKIKDQEILAKWRDESRADPLLSDAAFDWCIKELQEKAEDYVELQYVRFLDNETVCVKSDTLIPSSLQTELQAAVKPLLDQSDKDWHPNSSNQVLNLVHPSLYPLVYGRSRVVTSASTDVDSSFERIGQGEIVPKQRSPDTGEWSTRFQWLPCDVKFVGIDGTDVKITSYINNLHPQQNRSLYAIIEKIISASIEPWNEMLYTDSEGRYPPRIRTYGAQYEDDDVDDCFRDGIRDVERDAPLYKDEIDLEPYIDEIREYLSLPNNSHTTPQAQEDIEDDLEAANTLDDLLNILEDKGRMRRRVRHPEPSESYTYEQWKDGEDLKPVVPPSYRRGTRNYDFEDVELEEEFRQGGLQVIVKLSSIELSPDNSQYSGGNWHLEGMMNEHIVATAIYYYDVENVTESKIRFRQQAKLETEDLRYEQGYHGPLTEIFGAESMTDEPAVQEIGAVKTSHGRFLAFSNICQHRVEPFRLADPTRPGHRRFLVLWLVDPHHRIMSTAHVPPQQHSWWTQKAHQVMGNSLPASVIQTILNDDGLDWPMGEEEAKRLRLELMAERTNMTEELESRFDYYNLCEH